MWFESASSDTRLCLHATCENPDAFELDLFQEKMAVGRGAWATNADDDIWSLHHSVNSAIAVTNTVIESRYSMPTKRNGNRFKSLLESPNTSSVSLSTLP
jgi:hypothetical protein